MSFLKIFGGRGDGPSVPWDFVNHFSLLFRNEKFRGTSFRSENRFSFPSGSVLDERWMIYMWCLLRFRKYFCFQNPHALTYIPLADLAEMMNVAWCLFRHLLSGGVKQWDVPHEMDFNICCRHNILKECISVYTQVHVKNFTNQELSRSLIWTI